MIMCQYLFAELSLKEGEEEGLSREQAEAVDRWREVLHQVAVRHGIDPGRALAETQDSDLSEGLYLKVEREDETVGRLKWVHPGFVQTIAASQTHWLSRPVLPNQLAEGADIFSPTPATWTATVGEVVR
jgi:hypothetical protein